MNCYCYHGYQGRGCWGPGDRSGWEGYGRGYGCSRGDRPRFAGRYGGAPRDAAIAQLEVYLTSLQDEVCAIETDLAAMRAGGDRAPTNPDV